MMRIGAILCAVPLALAGCAATSIGELPTPGESSEPVTAITNAVLIDGTGSGPRPAHIIVQGDRIVRVVEGDLPSGWEADITIDAAGRVVSPGFIDTHAHGNPLSTPEFENFIAMGATTIALGQDGSSTPAEEMADWMQQVEEARPGPNIMMYIGHGTVRHESGVGLDENPSDQEIERMAELVAVAMEAGCFGMTTGLEYRPGTFSSLPELIATGKVVAQHGGIVMSHMRTEDDPDLIDAIEELVEQGLGAGVPVHVSHIKSVYGRGADRAEEILAAMDEFRTRGVALTADIYPYTASYTGISIVFPDFALPPYDYDEVVETRREELAEYLYNRVQARNGPEATLIGTGPHAGKSLAQVAEELEREFQDVLIDWGPRGVSAAYFVMDEELQARLLQDPHINVCSDGSPTGRHPRGHGTFARIIRYHVYERGDLALHEAIHKMTGLPAETTGLIRQKRGIIAEGHIADLLIFDPHNVRDTATFEDPFQLAEGFDIVLVNGVVVREGGEFTGERAGRMLRHAK